MAVLYSRSRQILSNKEKEKLWEILRDTDQKPAFID